MAQTEDSNGADRTRGFLDRCRSALVASGAGKAVYRDYYRRLVNACPPGRLLKVGDAGHPAAADDDTVSVDIVSIPGRGAAADAYALPFTDGSFDGIVLLDGLHHMDRPTQFFAEAARVLRPGGRLAMIEPGITPVSWLFYKLLRDEPLDMAADPLGPEGRTSAESPFKSNQAVPTLLFKRLEHRIAFFERCPELTIRKCAWLSLFAYPLSGGLRPWTLLPRALAAPLISLEDALMPFLGPLMGFRLFIVLEKKAPRADIAPTDGKGKT